MSTSIKPRRTANHSAWRYVDKREPFQGSSMYGEAYAQGSAPSSAGSWLSDYETTMYERARPQITYVVWSFYTPIAYFIEGAGGGPGKWYKVGQTFSSFTGRHRNGALRNVVGHSPVLIGSRGDWTVDCTDCGTRRHFTQRRDAEKVYWPHR